jgi:hypothetical protein
VNAVASVDPKAGYLSPRYEQILRHLYFQILLHHPGYVAHLYALKGAIVVHDVWKRFLPYLVLSPLVLLVGRRRRRFRREFLLILPTFVLNLVPPILTVPWGYDNGVVGAAALLSLLVVCGLYLLVRDWITGTVAARRPPETAAFRPTGRAVACCGLLLAGILALGLGSTSFARADTGQLQNALGASLLASPPQAQAVEGRWTGRTLAGWDVPATTKAKVVQGDSLSVTSSAPSQTPELSSPQRRLPAGSYAIIANGSITGGGLELQAWNPETQAAIGSARYWNGQVGFGTKDMVAQFTLTEPTPIQLRVADWTYTRATSNWVIRSIELAKLPE